MEQILVVVTDKLAYLGKYYTQSQGQFENCLELLPLKDLAEEQYKEISENTGIDALNVIRYKFDIDLSTIKLIIDVTDTPENPFDNA